MTTRPPFEFDLRVSTDKSKRKTVRRGTMSGASEATNRPCDLPGCAQKAAYRAPKSPDHLNEYFWFCRDHIREYNLKWNFFGTATDEEFQKLLEKDRLWERETVPFSRKDDGRAWARLATVAPSTQPTRRPPCSRTRSWIAWRIASSRAISRVFTWSIT